MAELRAVLIGVTPKRLARTCANIPATRWTAGRCRRIDLLQERQLTTR
jgi:hypothetical protein